VALLKEMGESARQGLSIAKLVQGLNPIGFPPI
jgi:hypothetical protein